MNVLVIAPHPDDEAIGCGGTLCLHADRGDRVVAVFLTSGELGLKKMPRQEAWRIREQEARRAAKTLGLAGTIFLRQPDWFLSDHVSEAAAALSPALKAEAPARIYLPHERDSHRDHRTALLILRAALKRGGLREPALRGYEVWTPISRFHEVQDISTVMARKLRAIRAHRSQLEAFDYARAVRGLNEYRGELAAKSRYAEVFETLSRK